MRLIRARQHAFLTSGTARAFFGYACIQLADCMVADLTAPSV